MKQGRACVSRDAVYQSLQTCLKNKDLARARHVHSLMLSHGLYHVTVLADHLIRVFAECGSLVDARQAFASTAMPSVYTWNAIISAHVKLGESQKAIDLYRALCRQGLSPDRVTFLSCLKACTPLQNIEEGRLFHDHIIMVGLERDTAVRNTVMDMYAKCGSLSEAKKMFCSIAEQNEVSWQVMIVAYVQEGCIFPVIELFENMHGKGLRLDKSIFLFTLKAWGNLGEIAYIRLIHKYVLKCGYEFDVMIGSALLDTYAKCGSLQDACKVFDSLPVRNVVTWGTMISAHVLHGHSLSALKLFEDMQQEKVKADDAVFSSVLKACGNLQAAKLGENVHKQIIEGEAQGDLVLANAVIDMYCKCGNLVKARELFDQLSGRDTVSWSIMVTGYVQHDHTVAAMELFGRMQKEAVRPSQAVLLSVLKACCRTGALFQGRLIHDYAIKNSFESDVHILNSLVHLYARCGSFNEADNLLTRLKNPDLVSWGALLAGYVHHGDVEKLRHCLENMFQQGLEPDITILNEFLVAASHAGLLKEGCGYFDYSQDKFGIATDIGQYNSMADLLGRAGRLKEAEDLLHAMPIRPNTVGWRSLLSGCKTYGNTQLGRTCFDQLPGDTSGLVLMSDLYADAYLCEDATTVQEIRRITCEPKRPGMAWIEIGSKLYEFVVGGYSEQKSQSVFLKLSRLSKLTKGEGLMHRLESVST